MSAPLTEQGAAEITSFLHDNNIYVIMQITSYYIDYKEHLERVLKGSTSYNLWLAVSSQRIDDALAMLSPEFIVLTRPWWKIWPKATIPDQDPIRKINNYAIKRTNHKFGK